MIDPRVQDTDFVAGVREAERALRPLFEPTPLQRNDFLSSRYGGDVWLKREDLSPVRSYKIRGAINAMRKVLARPGQGPARFVCASAGNHAQGMAFACRHFGVEGVVFMPVTTPRQKIDKTRQFGGGRVEIRLVGDYFDATLAAAQSLRRRGRRHLSAALRRRRRHRGPGDLRPRDRRAVPRHPGHRRHPGRRRRPLLRHRRALRRARPRDRPPLRRARRRPEPAPVAGGAPAGDAGAGRQLRRRRRGGADRRPQLGRAEALRAGGRDALAGGPDLRDDGRDAERRGHRPRARRRPRHRRPPRPRAARTAARSSPSSRAATSTSSACPTSRSAPCAGRAARSTTSSACRNGPARCASSCRCSAPTTTSRASST